MCKAKRIFITIVSVYAHILVHPSDHPSSLWNATHLLQDELRLAVGMMMELLDIISDTIVLSYVLSDERDGNDWFPKSLWLAVCVVAGLASILNLYTKVNQLVKSCGMHEHEFESNSDDLDATTSSDATVRTVGQLKKLTRHQRAVSRLDKNIQVTKVGILLVFAESLPLGMLQLIRTTKKSAAPRLIELFSMIMSWMMTSHKVRALLQNYGSALSKVYDLSCSFIR